MATLSRIVAFSKQLLVVASDSVQHTGMVAFEGPPDCSIGLAQFIKAKPISFVSGRDKAFMAIVIDKTGYRDAMLGGY